MSGFGCELQLQVNLSCEEACSPRAYVGWTLLCEPCWIAVDQAMTHIAVLETRVSGYAVDQATHIAVLETRVSGYAV